MTRNCPPCWQTNKRPSGAKAIAVGAVTPVATNDSEKPLGNVAAVTENNALNARTTNRGPAAAPILVIRFRRIEGFRLSKSGKNSKALIVVSFGNQVVVEGFAGARI